MTTIAARPWRHPPNTPSAATPPAPAVAKPETKTAVAAAQKTAPTPKQTPSATSSSAERPVPATEKSGERKTEVASIQPTKTTVDPLAALPASVDLPAIRGRGDTEGDVAPLVLGKVTVPPETKLDVDLLSASRRPTRERNSISSGRTSRPARRNGQSPGQRSDSPGAAVAVIARRRRVDI